MAMLEKLNWEMLPLEADRTKVPGFLTKWPAADDFESLVQEYVNMHPDIGYNSDEVSLMIVWLSGRLPVDIVGADDHQE